MKSHWARKGGVATAVAGTVFAASLALADSFGSDEPVVVVVGSQAGSGPTTRLTAERSGLSRTALPTSLAEPWRYELGSSLEQPPVVDGAGAVLAALATGEAVKVGPDGKERWRQKLGGAPPVVPPALGSDGSLFVLSGDDRLWHVSPAGALRFALDLGPGARRAEAAPLAGDDGSVVVATDSEVFQVDRDGSVRARGTVASRPTGGLIGWEGGTLITTVDGQVVHFRPHAVPRVVGSFGDGLDGGAVLAGSRTLLGIVSGRLVALDLRSALLEPLAGGDDLFRQFEGPVSLMPDGNVALTTLAGELFVLDRRGTPLHRVALEGSLAMLDPDAGAAFFLRGDLRGSPPLVIDPAGRIAYLRASGRVGVVDERGQVHEALSRFCSRPLSLLPAGERRLLVACRSGTLGVLGDG